MTKVRTYGEPPPGLVGEDLPGRLIVIEGTDGVGRSTQIALLKEWLEDRGYAVVDTGLRRSALAGAGIRRARQGHTLDPLTLNLLYATDFWDRLERQIIPALRAGMVALVDRYIFSLIARALVRGVSRDWIEGVYGFALIPDSVIYVDIGLEELLPRVLTTTGFDYWESGEDVQRGTERYGNWVTYQSELLTQFRDLGSRYGFVTVDGRRSVEAVFADMLRVVEPIVQSISAPASST